MKRVVQFWDYMATNSDTVNLFYTPVWFWTCIQVRSSGQQTEVFKRQIIFLFRYISFSQPMKLN